MVKAESCGHTRHEEVRDEAVLAHSAEPDTHIYGLLDLHSDTADMAVC